MLNRNIMKKKNFKKKKYLGRTVLNINLLIKKAIIVKSHADNITIKL